MTCGTRNRPIVCSLQNIGTQLVQPLNLFHEVFKVGGYRARLAVPVPTAKGRKLVLADRTEALVYILAHDLRHMWQQHGYAVNSSFPVGRVKNAHGTYSEVCTEAYAIHKLRAWRRVNRA